METLVLQVAGMSCEGCAQRIGTVLRRVDGVREVSADHGTGRVQVRVGAEFGDPTVLGERIRAAGFQVLDDDEDRADTSAGGRR